MTTTHPYPADVEAAAVDLIARTGASRPGTLCQALYEYAERLRYLGAFAGLTWSDARVVAATVALAAVLDDDGPDVLRGRADAVTNGWWTGWDSEPAAVACALRVAAIVLGSV